MRYIEAPEYPADFDTLDKDKTIFLAGTISGAWEWQKKLTEKILPYCNVVNPRRKNFNIMNDAMNDEQVIWEDHFLEKCEIISFWFSRETLAPITLFEFGWYLCQSKFNMKQLIVGFDPDYPRFQDLKRQMKAKFPTMEVAYSIDKLAERIILAVQ